MAQIFQGGFDQYEYEYDGRESHQSVPQGPPVMQQPMMQQGYGPQFKQFEQSYGSSAGNGGEYVYMPVPMMKAPMHQGMQQAQQCGPQGPQGRQGSQTGKHGASMRPRAGKDGGGEPGLAIPSGISPPPEWAKKTTVMMRNIPNKYMQRMLLSEIHEAGFLGTYDFLYLPIDLETNANKGYAFINFVDPSFAWMFRMSYEGRKMNTFNSAKVVSVTPAALQGFEANYAHYSNARVNRGDVSCRPLFLREPKGVVDFQLDQKGRRGQGQRTRRLDMLVDMQSGQAPAAMPLQGKGGGKQGQGGPLKMPLVAQFCSQCGTKGQPSFMFCPNCGSSMDLSRALPAAQEPC